VLPEPSVSPPTLLSTPTNSLTASRVPVQSVGLALRSGAFLTGVRLRVEREPDDEDPRPASRSSLYGVRRRSGSRFYETGTAANRRSPETVAPSPFESSSESPERGASVPAGTLRRKGNRFGSLFCVSHAVSATCETNLKLI
jgi:hypothetical protein